MLTLLSCHQNSKPCGLDDTAPCAGLGWYMELGWLSQSGAHRAQAGVWGMGLIRCTQSWGLVPAGPGQDGGPKLFCVGLNANSMLDQVHGPMLCTGSQTNLTHSPERLGTSHLIFLCPGYSWVLHWFLRVVESPASKRTVLKLIVFKLG